MKFNTVYTRTLSAVIFLLVLVCLAPLRSQGGMIFMSSPGSHEVSRTQTPASGSINTATAVEPVRERAHAPEPPTFLLMVGGVIGMIIRTAKYSFFKFKRGLDYVFTLFALTISLPVMLIISAMVKFSSPGPIIYRQKRLGKDGKPFFILKFRTMGIDAEKGTGAVWAKKIDPRVTPVGGFLRLTHLDELPQLFNVLKGDMSIVGPRPERPEMVEKLKLEISDYEKRLQVLPGITGLAQIVHKADETILDVRKKVKLDLLYIKKQSWYVELRVMALTCYVILTGRVVGRSAVSRTV